MKIAFLIRSLDRGGAERQLVLLARGLRRAGHEVGVLTFYSGGALESELVSDGVPVIALRKSGRWNVFGFFARLVREVRRIRPDLLHSYLPTANLLALAVRPFVRSKVVWGVRSSFVDLGRFDALTGLIYRVERRLGRFADLVVANSQAGIAVYGPDSSRTNGVVISNGFDTAAFVPDAAAGAKVRAELGIGPGATVIGCVARIDPMKDHETLLEATAFALRQIPTIRLVCVGGGAKKTTERLRARANALGIGDNVIWTGERSNLCALYNAFDLATLSSRGEGFPNVLGEAMACGVPCVASDVGAAAEIIGETGLVVPSGNAAALAAAWITMIKLLRGAGPAARMLARRRVVERFGTDALTERSLAAFQTILPKAS